MDNEFIKIGVKVYVDSVHEYHPHALIDGFTIFVNSIPENSYITDYRGRAFRNPIRWSEIFTDIYNHISHNPDERVPEFTRT